MKYVLTAGFAATLFGCTTVLTNEPYNFHATEDWQIGTDTSIQTGTLENGLNWYVQELPASDNRDRIELRLRIRSGSFAETDAQQGLAHFVEHMAFNGTEHFPKQAIVNLFEAAGLNFGGDLNAYTSYDETVYQLSLPLDQPELTDRAFDILYDWATAIKFDEEEVKKEALVVEAEWRERGGSFYYDYDEKYDDLYTGTRYIERLPIGDMDIVRHATAAQLREYYQTWYRPDNTEIYVAYPEGAVNAAEKIKETFAHWQADPTPDETWENGEVAFDSIRFKTLTDSERSGYYWQLYLPTLEFAPDSPEQLEADYINAILASTLTSRLQKLSNEDGSGMYDSSASFDSFEDGTPHLSINIDVYNGNAWKVLRETVNELNRLKQFGLTETEYGIAKAQLITGIESYQESLQSGSVSDQMEWLLAGVSKGQAYDLVAGFNLEKAMTEKVSLRRVNNYIAEAYPEDKLIAYYYHPVNDPTYKRDWEKLYKRAWAYPISEPEARQIPPLSLNYRHPGKITDRQDRLATEGLYQWTLENGISVVLKPSHLQPGKVQMKAVLLSGRRQFTDKNRAAAQYWGSARLASGYADLALQDFDDRLYIERIEYDLDLFSESTQVTVKGEADDLTDLVQLVSGSFTENTYDEDLVNNLLTHYAEEAESNEAAEKPSFDLAYNQALYGDDPYYNTMTADEVKNTTLENIQRVPETLLTNNRGMHLIITGDVSPSDLEPLLEQYIAGIPLAPPSDSQPKGIALQENRHIEISGQAEQKTDVISVFSAENYPTTYSNTFTAEMAVDLIQHRLESVLREDEGLTYGTSVTQHFQTALKQNWLLKIEFSADPKRKDEALSILNAQIANILENPFTESEMTEAAKRLFERYRRRLNTNSGIVQELKWATLMGVDYGRYNDYAEEIEQITTEEVNAMVARWLKGYNVTAVHQP